MKNKVLVVTHWFYPLNVPRAFRATELSKQLIKDGYEVDVVNLNRKKLIKMNNFGAINDCETKSTSRLKSKYFSKLNSIFEFFLGERFYFINKSFFSKIDINNYDIVISIGLPFYVHRLVASSIKKYNWKGIAIADWSDPYYKSHVKLARYFKYIQKQVISKFDYIVIPIEDVKDYYLEYSTEKKIKIIPQGFNFETVRLKTYKRKKKVTFGYGGIFYKDIRNPEDILDYLSKIELDFSFYIYTLKKGVVYEDVLLKYKKIMGEKLIINDIVDREKLIYELSGMDFVFNIENTTRNQTPSKLIDYALTQRPIISLPTVIDDEGKEKLMNFLKGDYEKQTVIDLKRYDIVEVTEKFISLFGEKHEY